MSRRPQALSRPLLWFRFHVREGARWSVYLTTQALTRQLHDGAAGEPAAGLTWHARRLIYIDLEQPEAELWETLVHELLHVACDPLGLRPSWEEDVVGCAAYELTPVLRAVLPEWPAIPARALAMVRAYEAREAASEGAA